MRYFEDLQVGDTFDLGNKTVMEEEIIFSTSSYARYALPVTRVGSLW